MNSTCGVQTEFWGRSVEETSSYGRSRWMEDVMPVTDWFVLGFILTNSRSSVDLRSAKLSRAVFDWSIAL